MKIVLRIDGCIPVTYIYVEIYFSVYVYFIRASTTTKVVLQLVLQFYYQVPGTGTWYIQLYNIHNIS